MALPPREAIDGALLAVLAETGRARPRDVYPRVTRRFPGITPQDLAETRPDGRYLWQNEIQWARNRLADRGWLDRSEQRGWWALTEAGLREAERRANAAAGTPPAPAPLSDPEPSPSAEDDDSRPIVLAVVPGEAERIAATLGEAARDSAHPDRLERAVGEALAYLGFEVEVIGGPGKTDVLAVAPLGAAGYRVVLGTRSPRRAAPWRTRRSTGWRSATTASRSARTTPAWSAPHSPRAGSASVPPSSARACSPPAISRGS